MPHASTRLSYSADSTPQHIREQQEYEMPRERMDLSKRRYQPIMECSRQKLRQNPLV